MPMTRLQEKAREKYITVKEFQEQYSLSKAQAYNIIKRPEMREAVIKVRKKRNPIKFRQSIWNNATNILGGENKWKEN